MMGSGKNKTLLDFRSKRKSFDKCKYRKLFT